MRYLVALFALALCSCEAFRQALADPVVQQRITTTATEASKAVVSGDWTNTEVAGTGAIGALLIATVTKWLHGRMKSSPEGKILG